ncbi:hypothetical protein DL96DRAFT_1587599 [Flagelloscypha sp. PMI_526]|nr:hypothetical protein DL96DRAFT_1587599 [Flagelloscypha sp. PMI_526]
MDDLLYQLKGLLHDSEPPLSPPQDDDEVQPPPESDLLSPVSTTSMALTGLHHIDEPGDAESVAWPTPHTPPLPSPRLMPATPKSTLDIVSSPFGSPSFRIQSPTVSSPLASNFPSPVITAPQINMDELDSPTSYNDHVDKGLEPVWNGPDEEEDGAHTAVYVGAAPLPDEPTLLLSPSSSNSDGDVVVAPASPIQQHEEDIYPPREPSPFLDGLDDPFARVPSPFLDGVDDPFAREPSPFLDGVDDPFAQYQSTTPIVQHEKEHNVSWHDEELITSPRHNPNDDTEEFIVDEDDSFHSATERPWSGYSVSTDRDTFGFKPVPPRSRSVSPSLSDAPSRPSRPPTPLYDNPQEAEAIKNFEFMNQDPSSSSSSFSRSVSPSFRGRGPSPSSSFRSRRTMSRSSKEEPTTILSPPLAQEEVDDDATAHLAYMFCPPGLDGPKPAIVVPVPAPDSDTVDISNAAAAGDESGTMTSIGGTSLSTNVSGERSLGVLSWVAETVTSKEEGDNCGEISTIFSSGNASFSSSQGDEVDGECEEEDVCRPISVHEDQTLQDLYDAYSEPGSDFTGPSHSRASSLARRSIFSPPEGTRQVYPPVDSLPSRLFTSEQRIFTPPPSSDANQSQYPSQDQDSPSKDSISSSRTSSRLGFYSPTSPATPDTTTSPPPSQSVVPFGFKGKAASSRSPSKTRSRSPSTTTSSPKRTRASASSFTGLKPLRLSMSLVDPDASASSVLDFPLPPPASPSKARARDSLQSRTQTNRSSPSSPTPSSSRSSSIASHSHSSSSHAFDSALLSPPNASSSIPLSISQQNTNSTNWHLPPPIEDPEIEEEEITIKSPPSKKPAPPRLHLDEHNNHGRDSPERGRTLPPRSQSRPTSPSRYLPTPTTAHDRNRAGSPYLLTPTASRCPSPYLTAPTTPRPTLLFALASDDPRRVAAALTTEEGEDISQTPTANDLVPTEDGSDIPALEYALLSNGKLSQWRGHSQIPTMQLLDVLERSKMFRGLGALRFEVVGQQRAFEGLVRGLRRWEVGREKAKSQKRIYPRPGVVMMCGLSGCGKTMMAQKIGEVLDLPTYVVNMASVQSSNDLWDSQNAGFEGDDEEEQYDTLAAFIQGHKGKRTVIVLDELDKTTSENALWALLKPWETGKCHLSSTKSLDVRNTLFIATSNIGTRHLRCVESRIPVVLPFVPFTDDEKVANSSGGFVERDVETNLLNALEEETLVTGDAREIWRVAERFCVDI